MNRFFRILFLLMLVVSVTDVVSAQNFWEEVAREVRHALHPGETVDNRRSVTGIMGQAQATGDIIKCLTPHYIIATVQQADDPEATAVAQMFKSYADDEIQNGETYLSSSGRFIFDYTTQGFHAVPTADENGSGVPDYVERAAEITEESYEYMVTELGFTDFLIPGLPYEIRFRNINSYGFTQSQGITTFIVVHHNFLGFPPNDDPEGNDIGALKVTIAHELKHAIQYAAGRWQGDTGRVDWVEMDATMMEEIVYDEVNDYYNYIRGNRSVFGNPNLSTPVAYDHVTWKLFYAEHVGIDFWVDIWDDVQLDPQGSVMVQLMENQLENRGLNFDREIARNHVWHLASGNLSRNGFGFEEAAFYPTPTRVFRSPTIDSLRTLPQSVSARAAQYIYVDDISSLVGDVAINVNFTGDRAGVAVAGFTAEGEVLYVNQALERPSDSPEGVIRISAPFAWEDLTALGIVFANPTNSSQEMSYVLSARELPEQITLMPNFPNPFNNRTTIAFALPADASSVDLIVYDVLGRRVATILRGKSLQRGFYEIPFDATMLASGIYIYRLQVGRIGQTGKMTLVK